MEKIEVEVYKCDKCGCSFEVPARDRMVTFTLHEPEHGPCPECGHAVFSKTKHTFSSSGGGKFNDVNSES